MSMIEQASKRLEQLSHAGFTVPGSLAHLKVVEGANLQAARLRNAAAGAGHSAERARALADNAHLGADADAPVHFSPALRRAAPAAPVVVESAMARAVAAVEEPVAKALPVDAPSVHELTVEAPLAVQAPEIPEPVVEVPAPAVEVPSAAVCFENTPVAAAAAVALPQSRVEPSLVLPAQPVQLAAAMHVALAAAPAFVDAKPSVTAMAKEAVAPQRAEPSTHVSFDLERLRGVGYLVPDQVRSEMAEQFRHLKRPLLKNARAKSQASGLCASHIMITSALPGEGKTFSSINLAMSMAMEVDTAVLLIDADVVRPSVFSRLGINIKPPGLLDLLTRDDLPLHEALVSTNVPKLHLMGSGERNQRSTELLASTAMDLLLARLSREYPDHVVIFDAPPLLLTNESPVLATKVGQVVVVVEAMKTRRSVVQQAFAALKNCPVVHSVLNKCDEATEGRRYGYYYG